MLERRYACWTCSRPWATFSPRPGSPDYIPADSACPFCGEMAVILRAIRAS